MIGVFFVLLNGALNLNPAGRMTGQNRAAMQQAITWPDGLKTSLGFASGDALGGMLVIVLVGTVTAQEYGWRTLQRSKNALLWSARDAGPSPLPR